MMNSCLKTAQDSLCVQSVNLKESQVFVRDDVDLSTLDKDKTDTQGFRFFARVNEFTLTVPESGDDIWDYRFIYSVGLRLIFSNEKEESAKDEYKPILEIVAVFEAKYMSRSKLKEDAMKAYSVDNVGYHVWPYWREYVQSTCGRIGFSPAFEVPVYIIPKKDERSAVDSKGRKTYEKEN